MGKTIALAGNPNSGKTTLFNALTGANQHVGNWPGVTVEKKSGSLKDDKEYDVVDLPGIYSLSPYSMEEVVARDYLTNERPDVILDIVDGTNLERNLYLTTQLAELGLPMVVAVNMMDLVRKNGDFINIDGLSEMLGCPVVEISALKEDGINDAVEAAKQAVEQGKMVPMRRFGSAVEHALAHIEEALLHNLPETQQRWYAVKLFERDQRAQQQLGLTAEKIAHIEQDIQMVEAELDDDAEAIIANERYEAIGEITAKYYRRKRPAGKLSLSDKIDQIVTNRVLALPIFVIVMFLVYFISVTTVGTVATDWANDGVFGDGWFLSYSEPEAYTEASEAFDEASTVIEAYEAGETEYLSYDDETGESEMVPITKEDYEAAQAVEEPNPSDYGIWIPGVPVFFENLLGSLGVAEDSWIHALIMDGIVAGVGAVLGFVPQIMMLFFLLAFLELCGYMSRVAFILDRIFRRFGLSGKSFIPLLIGTGCGVPGIMSARTIEDVASRRMTVMTTTFMPCGAKLPVIALFAGAIFGGAWWVAASCYFLGIVCVLISGIILKKTKPFQGEVAPFVIELPAYHMPSLAAMLRSMWQRAWGYIKKAFTIILASVIIIWFLSSFGVVDGAFGMVEDSSDSILAALGGALSFLFIPLGWADWQAVSATITGFLAKEELVSTFGVLYATGESANWVANFAASMTPVAAYSLLAFNLLCMPCFAAVSTIAREMNSAKWTWAAIGYEFLVAYLVSLWIYQLGGLALGMVPFSIWTILAVITLAGALFMLFRPAPKYQPASFKPAEVVTFEQLAHTDCSSCCGCSRGK